MKTLTVDSSKRIWIPDAEPRQMYRYASGTDGTNILTPVKASTRERFPRGGLLKYFTRERNIAELALAPGCALEVPD